MPLTGLICLLALAQSVNVEVPFHVTDDALIVDVVVNERPVSLMFDTGFSGAVVLNNAIDVGPATGTMILRDFVGEMEAKTVKVKSLKIGTQVIDPVEMEIVQQPMARMSASYNSHTDGILGLGALDKYVTEINFQKKMFIFHPKSYDISKRTPDGKTTFLTKMLPIGNIAIVMEAGTAGGKNFVMSLDTGNSFFATTHRDVLERVGLWTEGKKADFMHQSEVASGAVDSWSAHVKQATIFGVPVESSVWDIIDLPSSSAESDGTVGYQFLKNFNVTFDYERRRVWFERITEKVGNPIMGETGISAGYDPQHHRIVIEDIAPGSPAEKAGIKEEDELLSVGDLDLTTQHYRQIKKLLEGEIGSKITVSASRNGDLKRYNLVRASLVNETN